MLEDTQNLDTGTGPVPVQHPVGPDDVVGHKTFHSPERGYWHEPLMRAEADEIIRQCDEAEAKRREMMPDEQSAVRMLFEAFQRLKELGWKEACYCPKDGSEFQAIEAGSTGFHRCWFSGKWPDGHYQIADGGDVWPAHPVLIKAPAPAKTFADVLNENYAGLI